MSLTPATTVRPRALLLEATPDVAEGLASALGAAGIEATGATDALDALARAAQVPPDLVLVAAQLPFFDGSAVARRLRRIRALNGTVLVAHGSPSERASCLAAGFDGYLVDPLEPTRLAEQLREYARGRRDAQEPLPPPIAQGLQRQVALLTDANERLQEQMRSRSALMRNLAHELATPLTPLVGYIKLLHSGRLGELPERQRQVLEAMGHATARLSHSIDNLVDYSSIETGQYRVQHALFDASAMVAECLAAFHQKARARHLKLEATRPPRVLIDADERKLRQALGNLVDNAVRVSPHGGHVLVELAVQPTHLVFAVYDQGPGLGAEAMQTVEGTRLADEHGLGAGLGLPVARQIAAALGGELFAESPPLEQPDVRDLFSGSKVGLRIPLAPPPGSAAR